jgi:hypothetical protein
MHMLHGVKLWMILNDELGNTYKCKKHLHRVTEDDQKEPW